VRGQAAEEAGARQGDFLSGKYLLDECLGIGGMGEVYRATNVSLGRKVAIKILNREHTSNEDDVMRFLREARAAAAVRHPNVVDVFDVSRDDDGTPFIVQELLSGQDLEQYLGTRPECLSAAEALEIMIPVADAVAAAHKLDVVHRDLKPANIFLAKQGDVLIPKVLDFGACLFKTVGALSTKEQRMLIGTPHYMAPEQITTADDVDARADVWAMGVILYEMLAGETPFEAEDGNAVMKLVRTRAIKPLRKVAPFAPAALEELVLRCLDRDRKKRFADASVVRAELDKIRTDLKKAMRRRVDTEPEEAIEAATKAPPPRRRPSTKRRGSSMLTLSSPDDEVRWDSDPPRSASRPIEAKPARTAADVIRDAEAASKPKRTAADVIRDAEAASKPKRTAADVIRDAEAASKPRRTAADVIRDAEAASVPELPSVPDLLLSPSSSSSSSSPSPPPASSSSSSGRMVVTRSSIPPVLDPRAAGGPSSDRSVRSDKPPPSSSPELDLSSGDRLRASQPTSSSRHPAPLTPALGFAARPRPSGSSAASDSSAPAELTAKQRATLAAWLVAPALAAFIVLAFMPSVTAPLGRAMRGDSPLASGVLAVLTLVGAAALAAKSLGASRSTGMLIATVSAVLLGVVMIIVTFSAGDTAELGIPPAAGTIVPFIAPFVPLGLGLAALQRVRGGWLSRFHDEQTEAKRYAVLVSLLILALLELGPFGAVRAAARSAGGTSSPSTTHPAP
jgi:serine/threonine-protein kinase